MIIEKNIQIPPTTSGTSWLLKFLIYKLLSNWVCRNILRWMNKKCRPKSIQDFPLTTKWIKIKTLHSDISLTSYILQAVSNAINNSSSISWMIIQKLYKTHQLLPEHHYSYNFLIYKLLSNWESRNVLRWINRECCPKSIQENVS